MKNPAEVKITCDVIRVFKSDPYDKYNRTDLRVARWSGSKRSVLEKRRVWTRKDGTIVHRQLIGLTSDDIDFIVENQQEIKQTLKGEATDGDKSSDVLPRIYSQVEVCKMD